MAGFGAFYSHASVVSSSSSSASSSQSQTSTQSSGVYDVPGHPNLKVRIFTHFPKINFGKLPNLPSCNVSDPDSTKIVDQNPGTIPTGKWSYYINYSSAPSSISNNNLKSLVSKAFNAWQTKTDVGQKVIFSEAGSAKTTSYNPLDGKNVIAWGNIQSGAIAETAAVYDPDTGRMVETDTILNSNKNIKWGWTPYASTACPDTSKYDVQDVLTHEIGHWIGLRDEYDSSYADNTMFGNAALGEIKKDTLTQGDRSAANIIY